MTQMDFLEAVSGSAVAHTHSHTVYTHLRKYSLQHTHSNNCALTESVSAQHTLKQALILIYTHILLLFILYVCVPFL